MGKIVDFYKVAEQNPALKKELLALNDKYKERLKEVNIKEVIEEDIIAIAGKHEYVLTKEDFLSGSNEEIDELKLNNVVGGGVGCFAIGGAIYNDGTTGFCVGIGFGTGGRSTNACVIIGF